MKICNVCKIPKCEGDYYKDKNSPDKVGYTCKECSNKRNLKYRNDNPESIKSSTKAYRIKNLHRLRKQNIEYVNKRLLEDPAYKTRFRMKNLFNANLSRGGYTKKSRLTNIIGCSYEELTEHLNNNPYGFKMGEQGIDLDHIKPIKDSNSLDSFESLWHYTNLQLLPSHYNRAIKRDKPFDKTHFKIWLEKTV